MKDTFDMVRVEAATLATARDAGIEVPEFSVLELGSRAALLVKRFDVTVNGGRNHIVSMKTYWGQKTTTTLAIAIWPMSSAACLIYQEKT